MDQGVDSTVVRHLKVNQICRSWQRWCGEMRHWRWPTVPSSWMLLPSRKECRLAIVLAFIYHSELRSSYKSSEMMQNALLGKRNLALEFQKTSEIRVCISLYKEIFIERYCIESQFQNLLFASEYSYSCFRGWRFCMAMNFRCRWQAWTDREYKYKKLVHSVIERSWFQQVARGLVFFYLESQEDPWWVAGINLVPTIAYCAYKHLLPGPGTLWFPTLKDSGHGRSLNRLQQALPFTSSVRSDDDHVLL